jgi:hypothetical protein
LVGFSAYRRVLVAKYSFCSIGLLWRGKHLTTNFFYQLNYTDTKNNIDQFHFCSMVYLFFRIGIYQMPTRNQPSQIYFKLWSKIYLDLVLFAKAAKVLIYNNGF